MNYRGEIVARTAIIICVGSKRVHHVILLILYLRTVLPMPSTNLSRAECTITSQLSVRELAFSESNFTFCNSLNNKFTGSSLTSTLQICTAFCSTIFDYSGTRPPNVIITEDFYIMSDSPVVKIWHSSQRRSGQKANWFY